MGAADRLHGVALGGGSSAARSSSALVLLFSPLAGFARGWPNAVVPAVCGIATLFWVFVAPPWVIARWPTPRPLPMLLLGWIVLVGAWVALVELQARSPWLVLAAMAIVWIADTAAYFSGRAFGRRKLAPLVSPGKTWEGVYGAWIAVALYALALVPLRGGGRFPPAGVGCRRSPRGWPSSSLLASRVGDRRPVRVAAEAPRRRQGQRRAAARPRRHPRSHRRAARRDAIAALAAQASWRARMTASAPAERTATSARPMKHITLLGATGSIGDSTLDVIARHPDRFTVAALAAHSNAAKLADLCRRFRPPYAALSDLDAAQTLAAQLAAEGIADARARGCGGSGVVAALPEADTVLAAIVGAAGLPPTLAAARAGKRILLANKEALVIGGAAVHGRASRRAARRCCRSTASTTRSSSACPRTMRASRAPPACAASC